MAKAVNLLRGAMRDFLTHAVEDLFRRQGLSSDGVDLLADDIGVDSKPLDPAIFADGAEYEDYVRVGCCGNRKLADAVLTRFVWHFVVLTPGREGRLFDDEGDIAMREAARDWLNRRGYRLPTDDDEYEDD